MEAVTSLLALITTVNEVVELARQIQDGVAKVGRNKDKLARHSTQVLKILEGLEAFCTESDHEIEMGKLEHMYKAITRFQEDMHAIHNKLTLLVPSLSPRARRLGKFKNNLRLFWQRDDIEARINDLKDNLLDFQMEYQTFATMRIERRLVTSTATIIQTVREETQAVVDRTRSRSISRQRRSSVSNQAVSLQVTDERVMTVLEHHLSKHPKASTTLSEDIIGELYLGLQVDAVVSIVNKLCLIPIPLFRCIDPWVFIDIGPVRPRREKRQRAIELSLSILRNFEDSKDAYKQDVLTKSFDGLGFLVIELMGQGLGEGALAIKVAAVELFRHVMDMRDPVNNSAFISILLQLATLAEIRDPVRAASARAEAASLIRSADPATPKLSILKSQYAFMDEETTISDSCSLEAIKNGIQTLTDDLDICFDRSGVALSIRNPDPSLLANLVIGLRVLGTKSFAAKRDEEGVKAFKHAVHLHEQFVHHKGNMADVYSKSWMLHVLGSPLLRSVISKEEALSYSERAVQIYKKTYTADPQIMAHGYYEALERYGRNLSANGHHERALQAWKQAEDVAEQYLTDSAVASIVNCTAHALFTWQKYNEAVVYRRRYLHLHQTNPELTSDTNVGFGYFQLADTLDSAGLYADAAAMAEKAVHFARRVYSDRPDGVIAKRTVAESHALLAQTLEALGDFERASRESMTSLEHYSSSPEPNRSHWLQSAIGTHLRCQTKLFRRSPIADEALEKARSIVRKHYAKDERKILWVADLHWDYSNVLNGIDKVEESTWLRQLLLEWCEEHFDLHYLDVVLMYVQAVVSYADMLMDRGLLGRGECVLENAWVRLNGLPENLVDNDEVATQRALLLMWRSSFLCRLGRFDDGLKSAELFVALRGQSRGQDGKWDWETKTPEEKRLGINFALFPFYALSQAQTLSGQWEKAVGTQKEALEICKWWWEGRREGESMSYENWVGAHQRLGNGLMDIGMEDEAREVLQVVQSSLHYAWEVLGQGYPWRATPPVTLLTCLNTIEAHIRPFHTYEFFAILPDDPRLVETCDHFRAGVKTRPGFAPDLAVCLWYTGVLYCWHGKHEEGAAVERELKELKKKAGDTGKDMVRAIDTALSWERERPSWKAILSQAGSRLTCAHQCMG